MRVKRILLWTGVGLGTAAIIAVAILILFTCVFGNHTYSAPTCTEPGVCTRCGEIHSEPLGHTFSEATCTEPSVCLRCGERRGEPLGHVFLSATCTEPEICERCGQRRGEPLGHDMTEANFQTPATCTRCGLVEGEPVPGALKDYTFTEMEVGVPVPYTTASYQDYDVDVTGTAEIVDYAVIDGDETFPAREGYEWHIATVRLVFSGEDAQKNGMQSAMTYGDYYIFDDQMSRTADEDGMRRFVCNYRGARVQCWQKTGPNEEADWFDHELRFTWREGVLVPKGYDGVMLILYHFRLAKDATRLFLPASAVLDENALVFRMK